MRPISNWTEAVIASFRDVTPTVRELMIRPASGVAAYPPGSHLQVQVMLRGKPQTLS